MCFFKFSKFKFVFTARKRSLGQGNIFTPVCHSVHRGGGHAWLGDMHGCGGDMHGCGGACMVAGGVHGCWRGHSWLCRGCAWLHWACIGYDKVRSMSGRYASYWNAFFFTYNRAVTCFTLRCRFKGSLRDLGRVRCSRPIAPRADPEGNAGEEDTSSQTPDTTPCMESKPFSSPEVTVSTLTTPCVDSVHTTRRAMGQYAIVRYA